MGPFPTDTAPPRITEPEPLGAVLAGGASRRFGSPKARAVLSGTSLLERAAGALRRAGLPPHIIVADPYQAEGFSLPWRVDARPAIGPLGGLETALSWAADEGRPGAVCVACDLPFVPAGLLRYLSTRGNAAAEAVVPESGGRWGYEPLCAYYAVAALPAVRALASSGERRVGVLVDQLRAERVPLEELRQWGEPMEMFMNVNTAVDYAQAERIAGRIQDSD